MPESPQINLIYIAGYGRSGSTLLERIVSSHPDVTGMGEIAYLVDTNLREFYWDSARGIPLWDRVEPLLRFEPADALAREREQLRHESLWQGWRRWLFGGTSDAYQKHTTQILQALAQATGTRWLMDSSKTARERFFRPLMLRRVPGINVRVIHLVRDPRGCVQSVRRGSNAAMEQGQSRNWKLATLRAAIGWSLANASGLLFRALCGRHDYVRIRYEELANDPLTALRRIEPLLGVSFQGIADKVRSQQPLPAGEQFAGNRMRLESVIALQNDERWRSEMPKTMQWLVAALCLPVSVFLLRRQPPVAGRTPEYKSAA